MMLLEKIKKKREMRKAKKLLEGLKVYGELLDEMAASGKYSEETLSNALDGYCYCVIEAANMVLKSL